MNENTQHQYWLVQLGKLFYAGGLLRTSTNPDVFSHEFVSDESLAFPFTAEVFAAKVAEEVDGTVQIRNSTVKEFIEQYNRHEQYTNSEKLFHKEQESALFDELE